MIDLAGEAGGGQLLRSALTLSAHTGRPFRMTSIRENRPDPGLKAHHLTAVRLVADCCGATVSGDTLGSTTLTFRPDAIRAGSYTADIGTAGSVALLFDTLVPLASSIDEPLTVRATGGTAVAWAPPVRYFLSVKLPLLDQFGLSVDCTTHRVGYYPTGGGVVTTTVHPATLSPLRLRQRGRLEAVHIFSEASVDLEPAAVADRQATTAADALTDRGFDPTIVASEHVETNAPGSSLVLCGIYEQSRLGVSELGRRGKPAEAVAFDAVEHFCRLHETDAVVDEHMADQLLIFLALAGGSVRIPRLTDHVRSNRELISHFGYRIEQTDCSDGSVIFTAETPTQ